MFSVISHLFIHQREREAMKDERTHHGAMDESYLEQQICDSASIFHIVKKTGPILPPLVGLMASRQAGRQKKIQVEFEFF